LASSRVHVLRAGLVWLLLNSAAMVGATPVTALVDPRPRSAVLDLTGTLPPDTIVALDHLAREVRLQTQADLMVVMIDTTDGEPARRYATALFNRWGLGDAAHDDGLLVFVAVRDRKAEIILGEGVDEPVQVETAERIMQQIIVPRFKAGNPTAAVFEGAVTCARDILHAQPAGEAIEEPLPIPNVAQAPVAVPQGHAVPAAAVAPVMEQQGHRSFWGWLVSGLAGLAAMVGGLPVLRRLVNERTRYCPSCKRPMVKLNEVEEDQHLSDTEQSEERLGSVDYDVWACLLCQETTKVRRGRWFTRYGACPQCGAKTKTSDKTTTQHATTWQTGRVRVDDLCHHCGYTHTSYHTTPSLTSSDSSYGSSSGSSSSSSGGGGSSSGSGASGSW
jgi:uncharacterized protein